MWMADEKKDIPFEAPKPGIGFSGFVNFIWERGVMGLLIGFVLGGAVSKVTASFSADILNPLLAAVFGSTNKLADFMIGSVALGKFLASIIDFLVLAIVIYILFKVLKLETLDVKK